MSKFLRSGCLSTWVLTFSLASLSPTLGWSAIDQPLHSAQELTPGAKSEQVVQVQGVRVVTADYPLLARDFPVLARGEHEAESAWKARIDQWLVDQTGFIAIEQTAPNAVNSPISVGARRTTAFRPRGYGRAHVLPVEGGLMDAKGVGSLAPAQYHHGNGLATLGEMIRGYLYEKLVDRVLQHSKINATTVACYAVLDYGFNVIHEDGSQSRAGYVLRQAHRRSRLHNSKIDIERGQLIEKTLRRYGITSSGETASGAFGWDYINIQATDRSTKAEILDFGAFLGVDHFSRRTIDADNSKTLWRPSDPDFVQPDPALRVPLEQWGDFGTHDTKADKPWVWSHELAESFAHGKASRADVEQHLRNLLGPVETKLPIPRTCGSWFSQL